MTLRTLLKLLLGPLVLMGVLMFVGPTAGAQELAECTPDYEGSLTFTADPTVVQPGETVTLAGTGWPPDSLVPLSFNGQFIGTAETDASGNFTFDYVIPAGTQPGEQDFAAVCCEVDAGGQAAAAEPQAVPSCSGETIVLTQTIQVVTAATTTVTAAPLPTTGSDSASLVQIGIVLIVVGGLVAFIAARRRRSSTAA